MLFECVGRRAIEVSDGLTGTGMFSCASVGRIPYVWASPLGPVCVWVGLVLVGFAVCDCVLVPCATVCSSCVSLCVSRLPPVFLNRYVCTSSMKSLDSDLHVLRRNSCRRPAEFSVAVETADYCEGFDVGVHVFETSVASCHVRQLKLFSQIGNQMGGPFASTPCRSRVPWYGGSAC